MATVNSNAEQIKAINIFLNSLTSQSKFPSELDPQTSITDVSESHIIQKGTDDAKEVATALLRGFRGDWDASTNTPTLADATGIDLDIFIVSVAGTTDFGSGDIAFKIGDRVEFLDGIWYKRNGGGIELSLNTGVLTGGEITINGGDTAKFDVAAGTGYILDWTTPSAPSAVELSWDAFTAVTLPDIGTTIFTIPFIVESGIPGIGELDSPITGGVLATPQDRRQKIKLQGLVHTDMATITSVGTSSKPAYEITEALLDYALALGTINLGNQISENGANLQINKAIGSSTLPFINRTNDSQNPAVKTDIAQIGATFTKSFQDGSGGFNFVAGNTTVSPDLWDDGSGVLATVSNNQFTIKHFIFFGVNEAISMTYGQTEYSSLASAKLAISTEIRNTSPLLSSGVCTTVLIVKKGVTDLAASIIAGDAEFLDCPQSGNAGGAASVGNFVTQDTNQLTGNTGDKTWDGTHIFKNLKFILRNVADTFSALFTNTNTADRTYTLQDKSGTIAHLDDIALLTQVSQSNLSFGESYIDNYRSRVLDDGATYFPNNGGYDYALVKEQGIQNDMSLMLTPSAVKVGTLYNVKPQGLDFTVGGNSDKTYIDENGVIQTALPNVARIDYSSGDAVLLTEDQATNLLLRSEELGDSFWQKSTYTVQDNQEVSPDGTVTADVITNVAGTGGFVKSSSISASGSTDYVFSFYAKRGTCAEAKYSVHDPVNGDIVPITSYFSEISSTEYTRVIVSFTTFPTTSSFNVYQSRDTNSIGTIFIWGSQLEEASVPSSYIKTLGSTVTRLKDEITDAGDVNTFNSEEGVLFVEMAALSNDGTFRQMSITDATGQNDIRIRYSSTSNNIQALYFSGGSLTGVITFELPESTDFSKIAFKYKLNDFALWIDGIEVGSDNSGSVMPINTVNSFNLDDGIGGNPFFGKIKQIKVFKTALTDQELEDLTKL